VDARNGFRVIQKELKTFYDGTRKANLDVEIAVDMLSLAGRYDTQCSSLETRILSTQLMPLPTKAAALRLPASDQHCAKLIDVADYFIDLGEIADKVRKEISHAHATMSVICTSLCPLIICRKRSRFKKHHPMASRPLCALSLSPKLIRT